MSSKSYVDIKKFNAVKIMLNGGATYDEIEDYLQVSSTTIGRIKRAADFDEFKNSKRAENFMARKKAKEKAGTQEEKVQEPAPAQEQPAQVVEHRQNVTVQTTYYVSQKLDKITELLTGISAKLACIIDDLYGTEVKK